MAKITKSVKKRQPINAFTTSILASNIKIDGSNESLLDHIKNAGLHLTQEEKDKINNILENGFVGNTGGSINGNTGGGNLELSEEALKKIMELLENKADKDHTHEFDDNFSILASKVVETIDRKFVNKNEKEALSGISGNIQAQIDTLRILTDSSMKYKGRYASYSAMQNSITNPSNGDTVFIDSDETQDNYKTIYIYQNKTWNRASKIKSSNGWVASNFEPQDKMLLWVDTSTAKPVLKWYDGTAWVKLSINASNVIQEENLNFVSDVGKAILDQINEDPVTGELTYKGKTVGSNVNTELIRDALTDTKTTYSSYKIEELLNEKQNKLGYVPENANMKGIANGYAPLNSSAIIDDKYLRATTYLVSNDTERISLKSMKDKDMCYVTTTTELFIYNKNKWLLLSKGSNVLPGKNELNAERIPLYDDDELDGFDVGSIWINKNTKKAFICTDATQGAAVWELMAGAVTLNIGEIIPFKIDVTSVIEEDGCFKFEMPEMDLDNDYAEITVNGHEILKDKHYSLENKDNKTYLVLTQKPLDDDYIFGEVYKHDLKKAEEQMLKTVYDSNNNGKVDVAEFADRTNGFADFKPQTSYNKNDIINNNNILYSAKENFTSDLVFNSENWTMIIAEPHNINKFTTNDLKESSSKVFVSATQREYVNQVPSIQSTLSSHNQKISQNAREIDELEVLTKSHTKRLDEFNFSNLTDTPDSLQADSYIRTSIDGKSIEYINAPLFPIKSIIDSMDNTYNSIETPHFKQLKVTNVDADTGVHTVVLDATTADIKDMPSEYEHGKMLICNAHNKRYELVDKEDLTLSIENFSKVIKENQWTIESDGTYSYALNHNLDSENIIVEFTDENKRVKKDIEYKIIDAKNIILYSNKAASINCTINCALGVSNGYWNSAFDLSKIAFVDDTKIRTDRGYSSSKIDSLFKDYARKDLYLSKIEGSTLYASKNTEHIHNNSTALAKITEDNSGNILFSGKKLLTTINIHTLEIKDSIENEVLLEIYNSKSITINNAIIGSELLIKNTGTDLNEDILQVIIIDDTFEILNVELAPGVVQKYHLGISSALSIFVKGKCDYKIAIAAL